MANNDEPAVPARDIELGGNGAMVSQKDLSTDDTRRNAVDTKMTELPWGARWTNIFLLSFGWCMAVSAFFIQVRCLASPSRLARCRHPRHCFDGLHNGGNSIRAHLARLLPRSRCQNYIRSVPQVSNTPTIVLGLTGKRGTATLSLGTMVLVAAVSGECCQPIECFMPAKRGLFRDGFEDAPARRAMQLFQAA